MSTNVVDPMAVKIAQKLNHIRTAEREKVVVQNKLDALLEEVSSLKEKLNKLDSVVASNKYEITNCLNVTMDFTVITTGE